MKLFSKIVYGFNPLTILAKSFIWDISQGSEYTSGLNEIFFSTQVGSLSGALIKHVKSWVRTIPADRLHFFAMHFPTDLWKKLADLCHLHPEKDFPQCPWFLPFCFGKPMPENVSVPAAPDITAENICEMIMSADIDYSVARKFASSLNVPAKERISRYTKLDTVLWYSLFMFTRCF